jgi:hypothetical protein
MINPDATRDPEHWTLLSDPDKEVSLQIRSAHSAPSSRNKRNKRIEDFQVILDAIELFLNTDEEDKQCLQAHERDRDSCFASAAPHLQMQIFN